MTQRTLTTTSFVRPSARSTRVHRAPWLTLGEAVSTLLDALLGEPTAALPPEALREADPALHRALMRSGVDRERERLAANRPPLLY